MSRDYAGFHNLMNQEPYREVFNAALAGICANPNFFGVVMQQSPTAAVEFAKQILFEVVSGPEQPRSGSETAADLMPF